MNKNERDRLLTIALAQMDVINKELSQRNERAGRRAESDLITSIRARQVLSGSPIPSPTLGAGQRFPASERAIFYKHCFDPLAEASLANVVLRLRRGWIESCAPLWGEIHPKDKNVGGELEKHIATLLREGFSTFSQFLAGFELLIKNLHELALVSDQTVLGIEKLLVDLADCHGEVVEGLNICRRFNQVSCESERGNGVSNEGEVHE